MSNPGFRSDSNRAYLAYEERGAGEAIVLIHGHPFDRRMWRPQLDTLSDAYRVVAPDLPGYGASALRGETITMRALADSVVELLDQIEIGRALFVGLSMGGLVAMEIGLAYPERAYGLVLAATTAAPVTPEEAAARQAVAADLEQNGMLTVALEMAGRLFGAEARRTPAVVLSVFEMMITAQPKGRPPRYEDAPRDPTTRASSRACRYLPWWSPATRTPTRRRVSRRSSWSRFASPKWCSSKGSAICRTSRTRSDSTTWCVPSPRS